MATFKPQTERRQVALCGSTVASNALLVIDVQNATMDKENGIFADHAFKHEFFSNKAEEFMSNLEKLQQVSREAQIENIFTVIESLTLDGRDRSLDYKISGFNIPKGCFDAKIPERVSAKGDEIVIPKTSCDVFTSTNLDYVLRQLGVKQLIIVGLLTDQCVSSAVRHACDLGYLVTLVTDCCLTHTKERHESALSALGGFCRQLTTMELISEIQQVFLS